jgi:ferredoxin, 2Fe-2S
MVRISFISSSGKSNDLDVEEGLSVLEVAHANGIDIEGACEGAMACSTCHLIINNDWFLRLPNPSDEEQDMLDLTHGLTKTSRLGCQIRLDQSLDGLIVHLPPETHNMLG